MKSMAHIPSWVGRKGKPAKRVARSAGFAICSPRGMGDPNKDASGINASEAFQYAQGSAARKVVTGPTSGARLRPLPRYDHAHDEQANRNPDDPANDRTHATRSRSRR